MKRTLWKKKIGKLMKKTPLKKWGTTEVSKLKKKADKLMQVYLTGKYPKCDICRKPTFCMHHFVEKSRSNRLRYYEENLIPLCQICHSYVHNKMYKFMLNNVVRSYNYVDMIINKRGGKEWKDKMEKLGREEVKTNKKHYLQMIEHYTNLLSN
mgnify:FL=1